MIDTVILSIPRDKVHILDTYEGRILSWDLHSRTSNYEKYVKNPSPADKVYRPRLTGVKRRVSQRVYATFIKIEFSVPKLLYGNNLQEIQEADTEQIIHILKERLRDMEVVISEEDLRNASVTTAHFSKNIALTDGYTASFVAKELAKININKKFDLSKTSFRNNGQSVQGYTTAHSVVFYDKIADLNQDKKRAIDKDHTPQQLTLFQKIKEQASELEVLRMEVRICQKQKLNSVLQKLGLPKDPTFKNVLNLDMCQKVVSFYWHTMIKDENIFLFDLSANPKQMLRRIVRHTPKIKPKEAVYLVGLEVLCKDEGGIRDLRQILERHGTQRSWYRMYTDIKGFKQRTKTSNLHGWVTQIDQTISEFKPFSMQKVIN